MEPNIEANQVQPPIQPQQPFQPQPPIQPAVNPFSNFKGLSGWSGFFAVIMIISGALQCLWIIGAVFGVPLIIAGLKLQSAVKASREFNGTNGWKLNETFENLNSFFKIQGILIIIGLALMVLFFLIMLTIGVAALSGGWKDFIQH